jgi:hypothetical protein
VRGHVASDFDRKPFEDAMSVIYANVMNDVAARQLIERIRRVK